MAKQKKPVISGDEKIEIATTLGVSPAANEKEENKSLKKYREYNKDFASAAKLLTAAGATQKGLAQFFGVTRAIIRGWKKKHPEFKEALNKGKEETKITLAFEGLKRAIGYDYEEYCEKPIRTKDAEGNITYVNHRYTYSKHQPGDPKLLMFMLECLDRMLGNNDWKNSQRFEIETKNVAPLKLEQAQADQIAQLTGRLRKFVESKELT